MAAVPRRESSAANPPGGGVVLRFVRQHPLASLLLWACTMGQVLPWSVMLTGLGAHLLLPLLITSVLINWWEEVARMDFVQAGLQDRQGAMPAALAVPSRFALGWSCNRTGSLFPIGLLHPVGNATTRGDGFDAGCLRNLHPGDTNVTMAHLVAKFPLGLLVAIATHERLGHRTPGGPPQERLEGVWMATHCTSDEP